ncbi:uncharacterized protein LOC112053030 [Bicyclus anynana]|uniref:Uncharacterized protein LOC112053030 n=1 Tax=Bicyclus anynana TaxID=110368 RepID=A0ABM3M5E1_BICAN|nr:uncharacterized protein LOC112053030 [Bicyclus anynana]
MSLRQMRKINGSFAPNIITFEDSESDEEDNHYSTVFNTFDALKISSESESEAETQHEVDEANRDIHEEIKKDKKKKKNGKKRKHVKKVKTFEEEIDLILQEINKKHGEPESEPQPEPQPEPEPEPEPEQQTNESNQKIIPIQLFTINRKNINAKNEEIRRLGPERYENGRKKRIPRNQKTIVKHQITEIAKVNTTCKGIYMTIAKRSEGITYFVYNHTKQYQQMHAEFLRDAYRNALYEDPTMFSDYFEEYTEEMHIEAMLLAFVQLCGEQSYDSAWDTIERIICHLQYRAHPDFNILSKQHRLEFIYTENVIFHIAFLLYSHALSIRGFHQTALEVAKIMLNLDPADPLAVVIIIDKFAIFGKEYNWLIETVDAGLLIRRCTGTRDFKLLNIEFSYALAHYHVAMKNKEDLKKADDVLKKALLLFPLLAKIMIRRHGRPSERIETICNHPMYDTLATEGVSQTLIEFAEFYVTYMDNRWRSQEVFEWFVRNASELMDQYESEPNIREEYDRKTEVRQSVFRIWPLEVGRHLHVIKPMEQWLVDSEIPEVYDYLLPNIIYPFIIAFDIKNRYKYCYFTGQADGYMSCYFIPPYRMPHGHPISIFCIIATEFCERFSFCGLRTILSLYLRNVLCLHENAATVVYHIFIMMCYTMPLMGAILADNFIGRYRVILYFSIIYFVGTILLCCSAIPPLMLPPTFMSMIGLVLIAAGTGGIKPCVAAFGGDQFRLPEDNNGLQKFFSTFYCTVNLGGFMGMVVTPALRRSIMCFGDDACYALGFGFPAILVLFSIVIFVLGKPWYRIKKPRNNVTLKFVACTWYAFKRRFQHDTSLDGPLPDHWLDYSIDKYGVKLVSDMKAVCSILFLYLPVPIFWSLFDQQGSRWTFQASRLRSEVFGITLMPDQLQVMNPAMVLFMIPVCPGGSWNVLPEISPLNKMFIGGILAAMSFFCAGILQISIERSTLQVPRHHETGLIFLNTLTCSLELEVMGEGMVVMEQGGTVLMTPLPHRTYTILATCPSDCAGRIMKRNNIKVDLKTVAGMFMPIVIGQNSDDEMSFYFLDPGPFSKSLTGKPKLKVVYIGETGPNKNVSIEVETEKQLSDIYYVSDAPVDHIGESAYMPLQPGKFSWRADSAGGEVSGSGEGDLRAGGVYVLCIRERLGRLDNAVLHAPNAPNELNLVWIVPQYLLISMAEIMFAVSGLEFSFTQAPKSMKTITIAAWYMSVAIGNLIVILVAQTKIFESRAIEFFVYAGMLMAAMLVFLRIAHGYCTRTMEGDGSSIESQPLLRNQSRAMSVHSATTSNHPFSCLSRDSSGASCLGHMERARTSAWPVYTVVHVGTPSTNDDLATTLAKD